MTTKILKTQNLLYGFWGTTLINYTKKQTQKKWNQVFKVLLEISGANPQQIREFLDSRSGRHLADECINSNNLKNIIQKSYFKWIDKILFDDKHSKKALECQKDSTLFGTRVYNKIYNRFDIILYTYKNNNRIYEDYAVCMSADTKQYRIGLNYLKTYSNF